LAKEANRNDTPHTPAGSSSFGPEESGFRERDQREDGLEKGRFIALDPPSIKVVYRSRDYAWGPR
jgi:hypothetical protein